MHILSEIIIIFFALIILSLPIMIWWYVVSFFQITLKRRILVCGIAIWAVMTFPLLFQELSIIGPLLKSTFWSLYLEKYAIFFLYLSAIVWILIFFMSVLYFAFQKEKKLFLKRITAFSFFLLVLCGFWVVFLWLLGNISFFETLSLQKAQQFSGIIFSSFLGLLGYYSIVSILEESGKYIGHLTKAGDPHYTQSFLFFMLLSTSIALGFALFENFVYASQFYLENGANTELLSLVFLRSIFSLFLHIIATLLFALGMWYFWKNTSRFRVSFFTSGSVLLCITSIASHTIFNFSLHIGFALVSLGIVFVWYLILAYMLPRIDYETLEK